MMKMIQWLVLMIMRIMQWLALAPHNRNVLDSGPGCHCVESLFCWCFCGISPGFTPTVSIHSPRASTFGQLECMWSCPDWILDGSDVIWRLRDHHGHLPDEDNNLLKKILFSLLLQTSHDEIWWLNYHTVEREARPSIHLPHLIWGRVFRGDPQAFPGQPTRQRKRNNFINNTISSKSELLSTCYWAEHIIASIVTVTTDLHSLPHQHNLTVFKHDRFFCQELHSAAMYEGKCQAASEMRYFSSQISKKRLTVRLWPETADKLQKGTSTGLSQRKRWVKIVAK